MTFPIDHAAKEIALGHWVLPDCLHVPIAAVDETAIAKYIGDIEQVLSDAANCFGHQSEATAADRSPTADLEVACLKGPSPAQAGIGSFRLYTISQGAS